MGFLSRLGGSCCGNGNNRVSSEMLWFIILFLLLFSGDSCSNKGNSTDCDCESCC